MNNGSVYPTIKDTTDDEIQYFFISKGEKDVIKLIQYTYVRDQDGKRLFNLGFGNYDMESDTIIDDVNTNNGDVYKVFNTVLNTIPQFLKSTNDATIVVEGSDSRPGFIDDCRVSCKKKCIDVCKNVDRRMAVY